MAAGPWKRRVYTCRDGRQSRGQQEIIDWAVRAMVDSSGPAVTKAILRSFFP